MLRYLELTKPRIILLLTITGIVAYIIPSFSGVKILDLLIFIFVGYTAAGGAMAINNIFDKDMDILMSRTEKRPSLGPNALPELNIFIFGLTLLLLGIGIGYLKFGFYTSIHLAWGALFYLIGYTMILKRNSIFNTILGGLASPAPVWTGYAARYYQLGLDYNPGFLGVPLEGWLLGGLVFVWTPSHTWALSTKNIDDYTNADIPMLPVKLGMKNTSILTMITGIGVIIYGTVIAYILTQQIIITLALFIPHLIFLYGLSVFVYNPSPETATTCFKMHNVWLTFIFIVILTFRI